MRQGDVVVPYVSLPAYDSEARLQAGRRYVVVDPKEGLLSDELSPSSCHRLLELQRRRPEWYLQPQGFNPPPRPRVTLKELAHEGVRAYPGLDRVLLRERLLDGCPRAGFTADVLSGVLSDDPGVEMVDPEGRLVSGLDHRRRGCSFWPKGSWPVRASLAAE